MAVVGQADVSQRDVSQREDTVEERFPRRKRRNNPPATLPPYPAPMTESSTRRVQRVPSEWPVLHLEGDIPAWDGLAVDGLVENPMRLDLPGLAALGAVSAEVAVHCVWGWSRPRACWEGLPLSRVLEAARPRGSHVTVRSASGVYSSCLSLTDAASGMLAWRRDGHDLTPEAGGPLRFVPPPDLWAYKGVKWAARLTVGDRFVPGFWESKVADPTGRIPADVELPR